MHWSSSKTPFFVLVVESSLRINNSYFFLSPFLVLVCVLVCPMLAPAPTLNLQCECQYMLLLLCGCQLKTSLPCMALYCIGVICSKPGGGTSQYL